MTSAEQALIDKMIADRPHPGTPEFELVCCVLSERADPNLRTQMLDALREMTRSQQRWNDITSGDNYLLMCGWYKEMIEQVRAELGAGGSMVNV